MKKKFLLVAFVLILLVWLNNSSAFIDPGSNATGVLAHRGVHQTFSMENLENDTCTAQRINPVTHSFIENTIPSMQAAFDAGAEVVQLDIHLTRDKRFAVFHDWELECRTNGKGVTQDQDMAYLKTLDVGYGYTADGGATYPLRGKGVGLMPTLRDVFEAFPNRLFLINFKSRRADEGEALVKLLTENPQWKDMVFGVQGGDVPTRIVTGSLPDIRGSDKKSTLACLGQYEALGWTGYVPEACRNSLVRVPENLAWALWGWPHKFTRRMEDAGSIVVLMGPYGAGGFGSGIDRSDQLGSVPDNFDGLVWTDRVEVVGPALSGKV